MFDLIAVGEILVDFTPCGGSSNEIPRFEANAGGAPANVAVGAARLGARTAFVGKLGVDGLSNMLRETLVNNSVDVQSLFTDPKADPALAFVQLDSHGDRSFSFFRRKTADTLLRSGEITPELIRSGKIFYFGSLSLTDEPSRSTVLAAAKFARSGGRLVSFDPNYRKPLWKSDSGFLAQARRVLPLCHILKISCEEMQLLTGQTDAVRGMEKLAETYGIPLIFTTMGSQGCQWLFRNQPGAVPAFDVATVDTTGAGDSFLSAVLYRILYGSISWESLRPQDIEEIARFASAASSLTTTKTGAIHALPTREQTEELLRTGTPLVGDANR